MHGQKIRIIRELRGFSQEYLANKLGIAQNSYSKIETNRTKLNTEMLTKIADSLEVSVNDILSNQPVFVNFHGDDLPTKSKDGKNNSEVNQINWLEKLLIEKNKEIERLSKIIEKLIGIK